MKHPIHPLLRVARSKVRTLVLSPSSASSCKIKSPYLVLGPGVRAVIWFHGCSLNCHGCNAYGWTTQTGIDHLKIGSHALMVSVIQAYYLKIFFLTRAWQFLPTQTRSYPKCRRDLGSFSCPWLAVENVAAHRTVQSRMVIRTFRMELFLGVGVVFCSTIPESETIISEFWFGMGKNDKFWGHQDSARIPPVKTA